MAAAGIASRRAAEDWIRAGRVSVNGLPASIGDSADPDLDVIAVDGETLRSEPLSYWLVHKPRGVLTTLHDPEGRATIVDLLPDRSVRLFPVGRLDLDTEGLVLMTNDGGLAQKLLHPSHGVEREYRVHVRGRMTRESLRRLAAGVELDDGVTAPSRVEDVEQSGDTTRLVLTLTEGRKRQIRRALRALGHPVFDLVRVRMGPILLGDLPAGAARRLTEAECAALERVKGGR